MPQGKKADFPHTASLQSRDHMHRQRRARGMAHNQHFIDGADPLRDQIGPFLDRRESGSGIRPRARAAKA